ncbi:TlpA family protein disulfide reductase [Aureimonas sp. Leaf324]|uniref:TlpA family protein disulfide reductase n=1 Tax=Aureimonas sp. Leaf324 TaxID=1736336 RepID=UPI0026DA58BB
MTTNSATLAPELAVSEWFNTLKPLTLREHIGRPVLLHTFQLLCPGCVSASLPQVQRIEHVFAGTDLQVIGLHTVFEHHAAMTPVTLKAFLHEYRIRHPGGVDLADGKSDIPVTMRRFALRGTPSSVLIGRDGSIFHTSFGVEEDMALGARVAMALAAPLRTPTATDASADDGPACSEDHCAIPPTRAA